MPRFTSILREIRGNHHQKSPLNMADCKTDQRHCDFTLLKTKNLPRRITTVQSQLRLEHNTKVFGIHRSENASHRTVFTGPDLEFTLKQFNYYWAPPAYDAPCLWRKHTLDQVPYAALKPRVIGNDLMWTGFDFRGKPAASFHTQKTMLELTVTKGELSDDEIEAIFRNLTPVDPEFATLVQESSFAELAYTGRYDNVASIKVPTSHWTHERIETTAVKAYSASDEKLTELPEMSFLFPFLEAYPLDSVIVIGDMGNPTEVEFHFEHKQHPGSYLKLLVTPKTSRNPIVFPPTLDASQFSTSETIRIGGRDVYIATSEVCDKGPYSVIFQGDDGSTANLIVKPAPWTNKEWLLRICEIIIANHNALLPKDYKGYVSPEYLQATALQTIGKELKNRTYALMQLKLGNTVLDVGCGNGQDTMPMAEIVGADGSVVGVDVDLEMIRLANIRATEQKLDYVNHQFADVDAKLPFTQGFFSSIRCERVFQHLKSPARSLAEMIRVTKPGGWIVVVDTDHSTRSIDSTRPDLERILRTVTEDIHRNGTIGRELPRLFAEAGLQDIIIEIMPAHFTHYSTARQMLQLDKIEQEALKRQLLTQQDLDDWHQQFESATSFFAYGSMIIVAGKKPEAQAAADATPRPSQSPL